MKPMILTVRGLAALAFAFVLAHSPAHAESKAFKAALAQAVSGDRILAAFYKERDYKPIWMSNRDGARRRAFLEALRRAREHALPVARYDIKEMRKAFSGFKSVKARAQIEAMASARFLAYARDIRSGILTPRRIDKNMTLRPPRRDPVTTLRSFAKSSPAAYIRGLPPRTAAYAGLVKEKKRLTQIAARGGWGPKVPASKLKPGQSGKAVVALRKRLGRLGYGGLGTSPNYDTRLEQAVARFQKDYGLNADGIAGRATLAAVNTTVATRLMQVAIGLERLRWLNKPLGKRHILVNEAAFTAQIIDNGRPSFTTRVVVGQPGRWRTPEFEKKMTHLIINPSWYVPPSIAGIEYLPMLKENPDALTRQDLVMTDADGNVVNPVNIDYSGFDKDNFPYTLRQPPSGGNALGKVKFMFPNRHAIYLHDTPSKHLFGRDIRAYSHGCVRVQKPDALAYALLSRQSANPKKLFDDLVATGEEARLDLREPLPIYLVYRTAFVDQRGRPQYRADTYGVDRKVWSALKRAGVKL